MGDYFGTESNNQGLRGISWEYAQTKAGGVPHTKLYKRKKWWKRENGKYQNSSHEARTEPKSS